MYACSITVWIQWLRVADHSLGINKVSIYLSIYLTEGLFSHSAETGDCALLHIITHLLSLIGSKVENKDDHCSSSFR